MLVFVCYGLKITQQQTSLFTNIVAIDLLFLLSFHNLSITITCISSLCHEFDHPPQRHEFAQWLPVATLLLIPTSKLFFTTYKLFFQPLHHLTPSSHIIPAIVTSHHTPEEGLVLKCCVVYIVVLTSFWSTWSDRQTMMCLEGKKVDSTGLEPASLGFAPIALPIELRAQLESLRCQSPIWATIFFPPWGREKLIT